LFLLDRVVGIDINGPAKTPDFFRSNSEVWDCHKGPRLVGVRSMRRRTHGKSIGCQENAIQVLSLWKKERQVREEEID
jgi:hypothetical protein